MSQVIERGRFLDTDQFELEMSTNGIVQISMGPAQINISLDSAYELQYSLAEFLARIELSEY
jgi:hypothetical protein